MAERNIRNTQYPVQIPVVTEEEFEQLVPEVGAVVVYDEWNTGTQYLRIGVSSGDQIIWKQLDLKDL